MKFFTTSNNEKISQSTAFENTNTFTAIPHDTQLLCRVDFAEWQPPSQYSDRSVLISLSVIDKGEFFGRNQRHRLQVFNHDAKKRDTALQTLMVYDTLGFGILAKADSQGLDIVDNDTLLQKSLIGAELIVRFGLIKGKDDKPDNNWVMGIYKKPDNGIKDNVQSNTKEASDFESDIPF